MRHFSLLVGLVVGFTFAAVAVAQNDLPPGPGPGGPGAGGQQVPGGRLGEAPGGAQPAAGQPGQPGQPGAAPGAGGNDAQYRAQLSYALGRNFASNLKGNQIPVDMQSLMAGITDMLSGGQPKYTEQQLDAVTQRFEREMQQKAMMEMQQAATKNQQEEAAFLAKNGRVQGVQTTPSGLQYRVIQQGQGASPTISDTVKCNYKGTLVNGTEFDNSARHGGPAEFPVRGVIPGWTEALQKMHVGDKWQLFVPSKLAYGQDPPPQSPIEPGSMLVFEIELLGINKQ